MKTIIATIILSLLTVYAYATLPDTSPGYVAEVVRDEKLLAAMRYHGILGADWHDGRWTVERNGQTCRLYGETFEAWWSSR